MRRLILGAAVALLPISAHAGSAVCLWNLKPSPTIDQISKAYEAGGVPAVIASKDGLGYPAVLACGKTTPATIQEFGRITGQALASYKTEVATAALLGTRGVSKAQLDRLIGGLTPRDRALHVRLITDPRGITENDQSAMASGVADATQRAGIDLGQSPQARLLIAHYVYGRLTREYLETQF
jgi:hypothetical protein